MKQTQLKLLAVAVTMGSAACAMAQSIELSSQSIGTVIVSPGAGVTPSSIPARNSAVVRTVPSDRTGVDLGIRRNLDGTLYDALDPRQNPAAATGSIPGGSNAGNTGAQGFVGTMIAPTGRQPATSELGNATSAGTNNGRSFPEVSGGTGINNSGSAGNGLGEAAGNDNNAAQNGTFGGIGINNSGSSGNGLGAAAGSGTAPNGASGGGSQGAVGGGAVGGGAR